jgi:ribonuclease HI/probable phosphoglycerate mutase
MPEQDLLTIHTDGASRGNPGAAAFAYVISRTGQAPIESAGCLGKMTNNQAEYTALVRALEHALRLGADHRILVKSDSELMVKQMRGEYKVKNEELRGLYDEARQLAWRFNGNVTFQHVRREQNKRTDQLCNEALDGTSRSAPPEEDLPAALSLHDEAAATLDLAGAQPDGATVWRRLVELLKKHGVALP